MVQPLPVKSAAGHEVYGEDYCSGYMDSFGKWNNGFPCPFTDGETPAFCCGTESIRYCCIRPKNPITPPVSQLTLLLSVAFATLVAVGVIITVSCFHCACCLFFKKRQPCSSNSQVCQMRDCPSSASGVANMYSFSGTTTPVNTPRPMSRTSSSRSRLTADSISIRTSTNSTVLPGFLSASELCSYSDYCSTRPGSLTYSGGTSSAMSGDTVLEVPSSIFDRGRTLFRRPPYESFEPPPPYTASLPTLPGNIANYPAIPLTPTSYTTVPHSAIPYSTLPVSTTPYSTVSHTTHPTISRTTVPYSTLVAVRTASTPTETVNSNTICGSVHIGGSSFLESMSSESNITNVHQLRTFSQNPPPHSNATSSTVESSPNRFTGMRLNVEPITLDRQQGNYQDSGSTTNMDVPQPMDLIIPTTVLPSYDNVHTSTLLSRYQDLDKCRLFSATKF